MLKPNDKEYKGELHLAKFQPFAMIKRILWRAWHKNLNESGWSNEFWKANISDNDDADSSPWLQRIPVLHDSV